MRIALATIGYPARGLSVGIGPSASPSDSPSRLRPARPRACWDGEHLARVVGAADMVVGTGLLLSPRPSRWMLARTLLNVVIGGADAGVLSAGTSGRRRAIGGVCTMGALTANDYYLSRRLREIEASYNPRAA